MEVSYIRDLTHNYMVTRPEGDGEDFVLRMALTQNIAGLVPVETRMINDELYLYYQTDSLLSLENASMVKRPGHTDLKELFYALLRVERDLTDYLMSTDHLCLTPETVFTDPADGSWFFTCMPFPRQTGSIGSFCEALLSILDPDDSDAIADAYRICERAQEGNVRLRDLAALFTKEESPDASGYDVNGNDTRRTVRRIAEHEYGEEREAERMEEQRRERLLDEIWDSTDTEQENDEEKRKPAVRPGLLSLLFAVTFLADLYIRKNYTLTDAGNILSLAVAAICLAGAVGAFLYGRRARSQEEDLSGTGWTNAGSCELWDDVYMQKEEESSYNGSLYDEDEYTREDDGTVLLSPAANRRRPKLYGRNSVNNCNIALDHLPLTLGKLAGRVDLQLHDKSVSRVHAHINQDENGEIVVKDMNSTNGTYHNGIRLRPNESVHIRTGDEICFGNMVFEYL